MTLLQEENSRKQLQAQVKKHTQAALAERVFLKKLSEHADGERRGPAPI